MSQQIIIVIGLTFVIHLISTLAYAVRLVATRTGRIAISFSLFNLLVLISRTANSFQAPLLAKHIEQNVLQGTTVNLLTDFRWLLVSATIATLVGGILVPSFQQLFSRAVIAFSVYRSLPLLVLHAFSKVGIYHVKTSIAAPATRNLEGLTRLKHLPWHIISFNVLAEAIMAVGVLAALYAGALNPPLRVTASTLSAVINGVASILLLIFIDPYLSMLTDDVMQGEVDPLYFRRCVIMLILSRLVGTVLAQFLLVPAAYFIVKVAELL